ncbi:MAG: XRE family transcriptional regulator [Clostridia bacterium]|nr:XRE family transcriptional regulator [Clostridia bacterium]
MKSQPIRLGELREKKQLTQQQMADMMDITVRQYRRYELGEQEPKLAGWIFLADFFDVSLDYLVGRSSDPKRRP